MEDRLVSPPVLNGSSSSGFQNFSPNGQTLVGLPVTFVIGPLAGRTIRAKLQELQKADVGRKFLKRDRRPLDPPPCCLLTLYEVLEFGTEKERVEEILDYEDVLPEGWVCSVEMFTSASSSEPAFPSSGVTSVAGDDIMTPATQNISTFTRPAHDLDPGNNFTTALAGSTFVQAIKAIVDGRRAILFLFPDLSCQLEGSFRLRYRVFNVMCIVSGVEQRPVMASCLGGTFTVYNSRTFPGLGQPTALTRSLSMVGVHTNNRESIRRGGPRRKKEDNEETPLYPHVVIADELQSTTALTARQ